MEVVYREEENESSEPVGSATLSEIEIKVSMRKTAKKLVLIDKLPVWQLANTLFADEKVFTIE